MLSCLILKIFLVGRFILIFTDKGIKLQRSQNSGFLIPHHKTFKSVRVMAMSLVGKENLGTEEATLRNFGFKTPYSISRRRRTF